MAHRVESRIEYYWELRSKDAQNIKILMCPLYREGQRAVTHHFWQRKPAQLIVTVCLLA